MLTSPFAVVNQRSPPHWSSRAGSSARCRPTCRPDRQSSVGLRDQVPVRAHATQAHSSFVPRGHSARSLVRPV